MSITFPAVTKQDIRRAASVLRVSTEKQTADDKDSVGRQRALADDLAERNGWTIDNRHVYDETSDKGYQSGRDRMSDRPHIQSMLADARAGEFDVVIFKNPSRQSREARELLNLSADLRELGIFIAYSEGNGATLDYGDDMEQLLIFMGGWAAGTDWKQMLNNQAGGRHGAAREGRWFTGIPPTGYEVGADKRLVVNEEEAEYIRFAFEAAVAGDNIEGTTRKLNARWPMYRGKRGGVGFATSTVGRWLRNSLYAGGGVDVDVAASVGAPREAFNLPAPALVLEETFEDVRRNLKRTVAAWRKSKGVKADAETRAYALSGGRLVHEHGSGLTATFFGAPRDGRKYRCSHSVTRYRERWEGREAFDPCDGFGRHPVKRSVKLSTLSAPEVEALVLLDVLGFVSRPEAIMEAREREARRGKAASETMDSLEHAHAERDALTSQRATLVLHLRRLTEEEADAAFADLEADELRNGERIARLENEAQYLEGIRISVDEILSKSVTLIGIESGDIDEATGEDLFAKALGILRRDAQAVKDGVRSDLSVESIEWLSYMCDVWDLRVVVKDEGETYSVTLEGLPDSSAASTDYRRRSASPERST